MRHIDPERLALFAVGEPVATPEEAEHLADCATCVDDLAALRHVAVAGRASMDVGELETPPDSVWSRIVGELSLGAAPSIATAEPREPAPVDEPLPAEAPVAVAGPEPDPAPVVAPEPAPAAVTPGGGGADAATSRRRGLWRVWALAASFALVAGIGLGWWAIGQQTSQVEIAAAQLAAFPDHPDAGGTAVVEEQADGSLAVRVALSADAAPDTFREVWLIKADASALVSLGVLQGAEQTFAVPAGVDLHDFVLVDVSQEPMDGDANHSGDSIVRGELEFS